jgi:hypothetical protein
MLNMKQLTKKILLKDQCTPHMHGTVLELKIIFHNVKKDKETCVHIMKMFMFIVQIDFINKLHAFYLT